MRLGVLFAGVGLLAAMLGAQEDAPASEMPKLTAEDLAKGERLFAGHCAGCHGPRGDGGKGANLARPKLPRASDEKTLFKVISNGIPDTEMPGAWEMIDRELWQVTAYVRSLGRVAQQTATGDAAKGEQLYQSRGCAGCHAVGGKGGRMGPDLSQIGARRSLTHLRDSLVKPEAETPDGFAWVAVVDRAGGKTEGVRLNEDTFSIQLRDKKDRLRSFWKRDVKQVQVDLKKSPMPSYEKTLTEAEVGDIVAYLAGLGGGQ
jgi:putative heme-binding domain-containing protein